MIENTTTYKLDINKIPDFLSKVGWLKTKYGVPGSKSITSVINEGSLQLNNNDICSTAAIRHFVKSR